MEDNLKDVNKASEKAAKGMSDDMSDAAKKIDRDLTQSLKEVEDQAKTTGKSVGKNVKDGADKAGEGFEQMSEDANSNAREVAASFDGSAESLVDGFQGAAAEMFSGFGPAGAVAGLAVAAGLGIAMAALQGNADLINENKEKMLDLAQTVRDNDGTLSMEDYIQSMEDYGYAIQDSKEWFEFFQADAVSGFEKIRDGADKAGVSIKDAFLGQFGSAEDAKDVLSALEDELKDLESQTGDTSSAFEAYGGVVDMTDPAIRNQIEGNRELSETVKNHIKELEAAEEIERIRREAIEGTTEATLEDIDALRERNDLIQEGVTSELDYMDQVVETNKTIEENGKTLDINTQKGRDNQRALIDQSDAALDWAESQLKAGASADVVAEKLGTQREALLLQLDTMTGSREESIRLAESYGLIPKEVITEIKTNGGAETKAEIEGIPATKDTTVSVDDGGTTAAVEARVQAVKDTNVKVDVDDEYTVKEVQNRIDGIRGRDEVKIDVDDVYTVSEVQKRIDGIDGRDVDISVRLTNLQAVKNELAFLTMPRTAYVDIVQRRGQEAP
ncbi:hypothetical protein ASPU41_18175 [Arthrobacter sp. U41]|nr:hypothetical protein ASPU41_18175 [Arthrobacter sp. U41]